MNKIELKPGIYFVGVNDWNLRCFHSYSVSSGATYNAYLIVDEKIALIDTVKADFAQEMIDRISEIIDPADIDYVISNHVEMDHSGALPAIMKLAVKAEVVTSSPSGSKGLKAHYGDIFKLHEVKAGDSISLGKRTLTFVGTPMLHWPDNMVTYCPEEKILFSNDAFGQHYVSNKHFDDEVDFTQVLKEAQHYYANILMPFASQAKKAVAIVEGLALDMIAPSHGTIFRSHVADILAAYKRFSEGETEDTALVVFDSMWHSTEAMALSIAEGFDKRGTRVHLFDLKDTPLSDIASELLSARYLVIGSPTLNNGILPNVGALLSYFKGLQPKNKKGFAFGSYGWSGQSTGIINQAMQDFGIELMMDPLKINYVPSKEQLIEIENKVAALA